MSATPRLKARHRAIGTFGLRPAWAILAVAVVAILGGAAATVSLARFSDTASAPGNAFTADTLDPPTRPDGKRRLFNSPQLDGDN